MLYIYLYDWYIRINIIYKLQHGPYPIWSMSNIWGNIINIGYNLQHYAYICDIHYNITTMASISSWVLNTVQLQL